MTAEEKQRRLSEREPAAERVRPFSWVAARDRTAFGLGTDSNRLEATAHAKLETMLIQG